MKCRLDHLHTKQPEGYMAWHEWAKKMAKTHRQIKCKGCGKLVCWVEREKKS